MIWTIPPKIDGDVPIDRPRLFGWGWLAPLGIVGIILAAIDLAIVHTVQEGVAVVVIMASFITLFIGILLNGVSERRAMCLVAASCLDVEVNRVGGSSHRSAGWGVRALMRYEFDGRVFTSTPMPQAYAYFVNEETARRFANYLKVNPTRVYVDPKRPLRTLFETLDVASMDGASSSEKC